MNDPKGVDLKDPKNKKNPEISPKDENSSKSDENIVKEDLTNEVRANISNDETSRKMKLVDEGQEVTSLQRAKKIRRIRTKRERKSSIKNEICS